MRALDGFCRCFQFGLWQRFRPGYRFGFRCWRRLRGLGGLFQCGVQFLRVRCRNEAPASIFRQTAQAGLIRAAGDIEADHMCGKIHPQFFQLRTQCARVHVTGFPAIAEQHHGGFFLRVFHGFGSLTHGSGQWCLAFGVDALHRFLQLCSIQRTDRQDGFNVITVALVAVAIRDQPDFTAGGPVVDQLAQRFPCDLDLGFTIQLAPHTAGGVQYQHGLFTFSLYGTRQQQADQCRQDEWSGIVDKFGHD